MALNLTVTEMMDLSWMMLKEEWSERGPTIHFMLDFVQDLKKNSHLRMNDVVLIFLFSLFFTFHRYFMTNLFLKPVAKFFNLHAEVQQKFSESGAKFIYYTFFVTYEHYLVNMRYLEHRYDLSSHWKGWFVGMSIPTDIYYLYVIEAGFYFHSIYATLFMDVWKKDSIAMIIHHILANLLILFSLIFRYHRIGLIVLYLHDIADIFLEGTKIVKYINDKRRLEGRASIILEVISTLGFLSFVLVWFWCRLCLYPQIVLFSAMYMSRTHLKNGDFYFFFNCMLLMLYGLNVWWFHFIVKLIFRIVSGSMKSIEDTREYTENTVQESISERVMEKEKNRSDEHDERHLRNGNSVHLRHS